MNKVDKAQFILEGRCVKCKELLPNHSTDCSQHPWRPVLIALKVVNYEKDTSV